MVWNMYRIKMLVESFAFVLQYVIGPLVFILLAVVLVSLFKKQK